MKVNELKTEKTGEEQDKENKETKDNQQNKSATKSGKRREEQKGNRKMCNKQFQAENEYKKYD